MRAVEDSLRRLQTDWIDLYQVHRADPETSMDEILGALDDLVRAGKVRYIGTSTWPAELIVEAQWSAARRATARFVCEQPPYSILTRAAEKAVLPTCLRHDMGVIVWAPLNGGWLTGKYRRGSAPPAGSRADYAGEHFAVSEAKFDAVEQLAVLANELGLSMAHLALAWVREHPAVTSAIIGPKTPQQLADLLAAGDARLPADALDRIDAIVAPGTTLATYDDGWTTWDLEPAARRLTS
jgi:aryl-alcohol dehydrogenase (NADP+)